MRSDRRPLLAGLAALALVGACADLIGANFDPYEVEPAGASSGGATSGGDTTGVSSSSSSASDGGGGTGGDATSSSMSSTSSGESCDGWPAGSGEWKWATQVSLDEGSELHLAAIVPATSAGRPWSAVGHYVGTLFAEGLGAGTSDNPAPFAVAIGPSDVDVDGALALACNDDCLALRVDDAASDPSVWRKSDAPTFIVGKYEGTYDGRVSAADGTPYAYRIRQDDTDHIFVADTFIPSHAYGKGLPKEGIPDEGGDMFGIDGRGGLLGIVGSGRRNSLFGHASMGGFDHYFVGAALPFPSLFSRRSGPLTTGFTDSQCDGDDVEHARPLDVAIAGSVSNPPAVLWTAGGFCGTGPAGGGSAQPPGNGFVVVQGSEPDDDTIFLTYEGPDEAVLQFGSPATAIAAVNTRSAVIVGETEIGDRARSLPDGSQPSPDARSVFVSLVERDGDALTARWVAQIDAPGAQHAIDVAVRGDTTDDVEVFVAGTTEAPFADGGFASPCTFEGEPIGFVAKLDSEGALVWLRTFGRDGARPVQLRVADQGLVVAVETGVGGYTLEPIAAGVEGELLIAPTSRSFFVGELSF